MTTARTDDHEAVWTWDEYDTRREDALGQQEIDEPYAWGKEPDQAWGLGPGGGREVTMREKTIRVYRFSELSDEVRQRVKDRHAEAFGYSWDREALASLKKLAEHFDGTLKDYGVDFFDASPSFAHFEMPEMPAREIRRRLAALGAFNRKTLKGTGECKLTGYTADEDAIDGFRYAFIREKERDLDALMQAAFRSWLEAAQDDCRSLYEDEAFGEMADANDWEFDEEGRRVKEDKA
jgi:hypothetical protein